MQKKVIQLPNIKASTAQKLFQICCKQPGISQNILCQQNGNRVYIIFNRPARLNSFSIDMYFTFPQYIQWANQNPQVKYIIVKGAGGNFSSGNDLANFYLPDMDDIQGIRLKAEGMAKCLEVLATCIIKSKKPIFALVEGRCIGFAFTQLALYDKVFAVKSAHFMAPLVKIAQGPEMSSSYTFPKIFGQQLGQQLIIKALKITAERLQQFGFLQCFASSQIAQDSLDKHIGQLQQLDWQSYIAARNLMRRSEQDSLLTANVEQCRNLIERWSNPDLPNYLVEYMNKTKALKGGKSKL